jgi:hypothetical protein
MVVDENGNWNWRILENWLPAEIMYKIATILPPDDSAGDDKQQWQGNSAKAFSITNIYHDICGFNQRDSDDKWKRVWKLNTPERVKTHDRILTNGRKYKMGLGDNTCRYCGSIEETTLHALRDCPVLAMVVWIHLVHQDMRNQFFNSELHEWVSSNLDHDMDERVGNVLPHALVMEE